MTTKEILLYASIGIVAILALPINVDHHHHKTYNTPPKVKNPTQVTISKNTNDPKIGYSDKYNSTFYCAMCEFMINQGEEFITKNTSNDDAVHFMEHLCARLPKSKFEECEDFVKDNYDKLIDFIVEKESAQSVCTQLHFCEEYDHQISECDFCKYASHRIERFLSNNNTITNIIEFGNFFCENYPKKYLHTCNNVIPYYYSSIIAKIVDQFDFVETCKSIGVCH